jgi:adenylate cyclase
VKTTFLSYTVAGRQAQLDLAPEGVWRIGRGEQNTIELHGELVSRNHAMIQTTDTSTYVLYDLGSRNGTFLNGKRVTTPVTLRDQDRILVGGHQIIFSRRRTGMTELQAGPKTETVGMVDLQMITVLVVDIRGYTQLSERTDAAALGQLMGTFFREAGAIVDGHGAWGQKFIGDAIMAIWIHQRPGSHERTVASAFEALADLHRLTEGLQDRFGLSEPVKIGAGINSGYASIGNLGSGAQADYTALGEAVNKAFRLETATKDIHHEIAIGPETRILLGRILDPDEYLCERRVAMKGYSKPCQVFALDFANLPTLLDARRERMAS